MQNNYQKNYYLGVVFILLHATFDVLFYSICKNMQSKTEVSPLSEIIFILSYNIKAMFMIVAIGCLNKLCSYNLLQPILSNIVNYMLMSFFSVMGFIYFLYSLQFIIIANAMSLKYIEQVLWIIVGILLLKETVNYIQLAGIFVSVLGMAIVIWGSNKSDHGLEGYLFPIIAAICWTVSSYFGKIIIISVKNLWVHMVSYYFFHILVLVLLLLYYIIFTDNYYTHILHDNFNIFSPEFLVHILSMSCFYKAMQTAPMSLLAPFVYTKLIFSALLGYLIFGDQYTLLDIVAYILIIWGGITVLHSITKLNSANDS